MRLLSLVSEFSTPTLAFEERSRIRSVGFELTFEFESLLGEALVVVGVVIGFDELGDILDPWIVPCRRRQGHHRLCWNRNHVGTGFFKKEIGEAARDCRRVTDHKRAEKSTLKIWIEKEGCLDIERCAPRVSGD